MLALLALGFGGAFFSTTKADIAEVKGQEIYILEYFTTSLGATTFDFAFERMAKQLCPDGYEVLDKNNGPKDHPQSMTRWLIECNEKKKI